MWQKEQVGIEEGGGGDYLKVIFPWERNLAENWSRKNFHSLTLTLSKYVRKPLRYALYGILSELHIHTGPRSLLSNSFKLSAPTEHLTDYITPIA